MYRFSVVSVAGATPLLRVIRTKNVARASKRSDSSQTHDEPLANRFACHDHAVLSVSAVSCWSVLSLVHIRVHTTCRKRAKAHYPGREKARCGSGRRTLCGRTTYSVWRNWVKVFGSNEGRTRPRRMDI